MIPEIKKKSKYWLENKVKEISQKTNKRVKGGKRYENQKLV